LAAHGYDTSMMGLGDTTSSDAASEEDVKDAKEKV
jgi:hypothetical protein